MSKVNVASGAHKFADLVSDLNRLGCLRRDSNGAVDIDYSLSILQERARITEEQFNKFKTEVVSIAKTLFDETEQYQVNINTLACNIAVKICGMEENRFGRIQRQIRNAILTSPEFKINNSIDGTFVSLAPAMSEGTESSDEESVVTRR